jgi:hypothetical protein
MCCDANVDTQAEADAQLLVVNFSDDELERAADSKGQAVTWQGCTWNFPCKF